MAKAPLPDSLHICLVGQRFQILSRATDSGLLWPLARGLARQGHKVSVISTRSPLGRAEVEREGVKAYYLHEGNSPYTGMSFQEAAYQKFLELHKAQPFHIMHSLDDSGRKIARHRKELRIAAAFDVEATQMSQLFSILGMGQDTAGGLLTTYIALVYKFLATYPGRDRKILRSADGMFVTNPQQRLLLERYYLYPDSRTYTVPYGAEFGDSSGRENPLELKKRLGLPEHAQVAVTMSDMAEVGELIPLLHAFEKVAVKKPNAYLILLGTGPHFKRVEYEVLSLALGSRVLMPGALNNLEALDFIMMGDVFINLSSRSTGFEPGTLEAMAHQKVLIGSEVSPLSNLIEDGVDGFLIRPADVDSLANLLLELFAGTLPALDIGQKARKKVLDFFDPQRMVHSTIDAYQKILTNTGLFRSFAH
ncbi:MAG: glycosyltransferase family 4 protein [Bdellovibrionaceae bacterium]|nr:glycosyltransferase family 4 protein [Pseudobdellovibrionaceae bacterium]MBX3034694.1 glycosyltransferase family 4 protein [Pseudobdellovibrionaceae bacterium]